MQSAWTWACEDRDAVEWHQGCPWCAVWVILLEDPALLARWQAVRDALAPWLWPGYARQPHITVAYRGLMGSGDDGAEHPAAQWNARSLRDDLQRLKHLGHGVQALHLKGYGSFSTVPYLGVQPHAGLQQLHQALSLPVEDPHWQYVPHVTLGHYAQVVPMAQVQARLAHAVAQHGWERHLPVERLTLVRYRSSEMAGPLVPEGHWNLRTQQYHLHPQAFLQPAG